MTLKVIDGDAKSVNQLEQEMFEQLLELANLYLPDLEASRSPWAGMLRTLQHTARNQLGKTKYLGT